MDTSSGSDRICPAATQPFVNMSELISLLQRTQGKTFTNEDGITDSFELLPPMSPEEIIRLQSRIPCALPSDIQELLQFSAGFRGGPLEKVTFAEIEGGFGLDAVFPYAIPIAADGFGNYWVVDLTLESTAWGPIFYACHDAPFVIFQCDSLLRFVEETIRFGNEPWQGEVNDVHEGLSTRIWRENPNVLSHSQCLNADDRHLRSFAASLDETWQFVDLRKAKLGDGFSWGRYGPKTVNKRFGHERIFAYHQKSKWWRFKDKII